MDQVLDIVGDQRFVQADTAFLAIASFGNLDGLGAGGKPSTLVSAMEVDRRFKRNERPKPPELVR